MPGIKRLLALIVAVLLLLTPAAIAQGAPGGGGGPPEGVGNRPDGVGGGKPDNAASKKGDIYADLMVIARYDTGVPMTISYTVVAEEGAEPETHVCVRPITWDSSLGYEAVLTSYPNAYPTFGWVDATTKAPMYFVPLVGDQAVALDLEPCDVYPGSTADETDLGRLNLGRAPERVLDKHLRTVSDWLDVGDSVSIGLDASGRFTQLDAAGNVLDTVDSPLENLAAMQSILETGYVDDEMPKVQLSPLELAAVQLGAAAPKEDGFEQMVDVVQYLGRILSIPKDSEWEAVTPVLTGENYLTPDELETFLNFGEEPLFSYERSEMFPGCINWFDLDGEKANTLMSLVFGGVEAEAEGIEAYTQLAADAREVLVTVHDLGTTVLGVDDIRTQSGEVPCSIPEEG